MICSFIVLFAPPAILSRYKIHYTRDINPTLYYNFSVKHTPPLLIVIQDKFARLMNDAGEMLVVDDDVIIL